MDFVYAQDMLTPVQWLLRAVVGFFFLLFAVKLIGRHSISQLRLLDFTMALILGNIISNPLSDKRLELQGPIIAIGVLVTLYTIGTFLTLKLPALKHWFEPAPLSLIENGQILDKNLNQAKISIDFLLSQLRKEKITDIQTVALALWEPDGNISVFLDPKHQPVTLADLQLQPPLFSFPYAVIKDGKIDNAQLKKLGKDERWLKDRLQVNNRTAIEEVLLATIDEDEQLKIWLYR